MGMTNEEAIKVLQTYDMSEDNEDKEFIDAVVMAVKALKQEPCEDAISRQATIDALWKALHEYEDKTEKQFIDSEELDIADWIEHRIFVQNMSDIDRQTILNMPSVKPQYTEAEIQKMQEMEQAEIEKAYELGKADQPKMGHWKRVSADKYVQHATYYYRCSECDNDIIGEHNYCPHCGAKMEEEQDAH